MIQHNDSTDAPPEQSAMPVGDRGLTMETATLKAVPTHGRRYALPEGLYSATASRKKSQDV